MLNDFLNRQIYIQVQPNTPLEDLQRLEDVTGKMWSDGEHLADFVPTRTRNPIGPVYYCCYEDGIYFSTIEPSEPWVTISTFLDWTTEIDISEKDLMDLLE